MGDFYKGVERVKDFFKELLLKYLREFILFVLFSVFFIVGFVLMLFKNNVVCEILAIIFMLVTLICFLIFATFAYKSLNKLIVEKKKLYEIATLSDTFFLEYDYRHNVLYPNGLGIDLFDSKNVIPDFTHWIFQAHNIFKDDAQILYNVFSNMKVEQNSFEVRFLNHKSLQYEWYKGDCHMIKENGHPLKMLCRMSSINIEKKILADLEEKARHDSLTGLFNKETFDQAARIAIQDVGFFVIFDIDHFKQINDTKGHLKGDEVLKEVAKITRDFFKDAIIGRVGGDEFAMYVSNNLNIEGFKDYFLTNISDSDVTISLGSCNTIHYEDYEAIYKKADELMYMAKNEPGFSFKVQ